MPRLRDLQTAFVRSLRDPDDAIALAAIGLLDDAADPGIPATARIGIHRNTHIGTLTTALRQTFPAVEALVGVDFFETAIALFVQERPPRAAGLNDYGCHAQADGAATTGPGFPAFLARLPATASLPYLPDVARLEAAIAAAAQAPDAGSLTPQALAGLGDAAADHALTPHPSLRLVTVTGPIEILWRAVLDHDDATLRSLALPGNRRGLLVYRATAGVTINALDPAQTDFAARLCGGQPLRTILDDATPAALLTLFAELLAAGCFTATRPLAIEMPS
ncbi:MAG: DNA-binding domain-containing protein [Azospirillaceae bacterium]|nr:DNA-binding domain-containing protein [Azospirillaceae bacterium]